jgi:hypothetical protein
MIPTEEIHQLADHWSESGDAVSLYLRPGTPSELAHREEPLLAKEQIQQVFGSVSGHAPAVRSDIGRMLEVAAAMKGNHGQAKVIFACERANIWREYDLPPVLPTSLGSGPSFAVAPLAGILQKPKRYLIALADRNRARLFLLENDQINERTQQLEEERDQEADKSGLPVQAPRAASSASARNSPGNTSRRSAHSCTVPSCVGSSMRCSLAAATPCGPRSKCPSILTFVVHSWATLASIPDLPAPKMYGRARGIS